MPNWCYSSVNIRGPKDEIGKFDKQVKEACSSNPLKADFGDWWLGNLLLHLGYKDDDVVQGDIRCRGSIIDYDVSYEENYGDILLSVESAWGPHLGPIVLMRDKYAPNCEILYVAEELGCGLFWSNDPEYYGKWYVDVWDYEIEDLVPLHDCVPISDESLVRTLEGILGHSGSISELIQEIRVKYPDSVGFDKYENVPLSETF